MIYCIQTTAAAAFLLASIGPAASTARAADAEEFVTQACAPSPLGNRQIYLRGSFNHWQAADEYQFHYSCNRYVLVIPLEGDHSFKIADDNWSADADFGGSELKLISRGAALTRQFNGTYRFQLSMSQPDPNLSIKSCASAPFGSTTLFLRGSMNNWAALDQFAFQFSCDAYYLNVELASRHEFKIADAGWHPATTVGSRNGRIDALEVADASGDIGGVHHWFEGEHTIRLAFNNGQPQLSVGPKSFVDGGAVVISDPVALSVRFNSQSLQDKSPFGAITTGSSATFQLKALPGIEKATLVIEKRRLEGNQEVLEYHDFARIPMRSSRNAASPLETWGADMQFPDIAVYGYYFELLIGGKTFVYQNNNDTIHWTREKGSMGLGLIDEMPESARRIRRYRQTVHAADFAVPDWAQDIIYYYIFPERFRNGDQRNDPKPGIDRYQNKTVEFHKNWMDKPWKPRSGDGSDNTYNNDFFGGDLAGVIEKLDYIKDLGANTLYMTPIFKAASNHKYDTADYRVIDPAFGTKEEFQRLTREAMARSMRIILDASLNHVGSDSIYFDRFGNHKSGGAFESGKVRKDSPYADWFSFDTAQSDPDKKYKGWVGVKDLPEINKQSISFRDFAFGATDSVMKLWLDRGAAGWRMDVAPWVPDDFWREWRAEIKRHKPDALTVSETWFDSSKYFLGDMFDSTMNYIFRNAVLDFAGGGNAREAYRHIELIREVYPPQAFYALMNLLSTHDQPRALHHFGFTDGKATAETIRRAKQSLRLATFFQMTFPGAPTIFYGDEVGVTGGEDPYNRAPYPWADHGGSPDEALLADFKRLTKMRNTHEILRRGSLDAPLYLDEHVIVLERRLGKSIAIVAMNNADKATTIQLKRPAESPAFYTDARSSTIVPLTAGTLALMIPAKDGIVLLSQ